MYDTLKCLILSGTVTLFANVPELFEWPVEKIGFGALLFLIIWTYLNRILPKTHDELERKNKRIEELIDQIGKLNDINEHNQRIIEQYIRNANRPVPHGEVRFEKP